MAADALLLCQVLPCPSISLHVRPDGEGVDQRKSALEVVAHISRRRLPILRAGLDKGRPGSHRRHDARRHYRRARSGRVGCASHECQRSRAGEAAQEKPRRRSSECLNTSVPTSTKRGRYCCPKRRTQRRRKMAIAGWFYCKGSLLICQEFSTTIFYKILACFITAQSLTVIKRLVPFWVSV